MNHHHKKQTPPQNVSIWPKETGPLPPFDGCPFCDAISDGSKHMKTKAKTSKKALLKQQLDLSRQLIQQFQTNTEVLRDCHKLLAFIYEDNREEAAARANFSRTLIELVSPRKPSKAPGDGGSGFEPPSIGRWNF
jgi:hypothetical protein